MPLVFHVFNVAAVTVCRVAVMLWVHDEVDLLVAGRQSSTRASSSLARRLMVRICHSLSLTGWSQGTGSFITCINVSHKYTLITAWICISNLHCIERSTQVILIMGIFTHWGVTVANRKTTRMVQLPATAAIEHVAACCRTRTRTRTKTKIGTLTKTVRGPYARSPKFNTYTHRLGFLCLAT